MKAALYMAVQEIPSECAKGSLDLASLRLQIGLNKSRHFRILGSHHVSPARQPGTALRPAHTRPEERDPDRTLRTRHAPAGDAFAGARSRPVAQHSPGRIRTAGGR